MSRRLIRSKLTLILVAGATAILWAVLGPARASAPSGWYTISGSGATATVADTRTGLVWQRAPDMTLRDFRGATNYCAGLGGRWRLPSMTELQTIVDDTRPVDSSMIDEAAFPGTPNYLFWTSSLHSDGDVWTVHFAKGNTGTPRSFSLPAYAYVRCVR